MEPQITIRLLSDASGFPLMVEAFDGNNAQINAVEATMITASMVALQMGNITLVTDAGMIPASWRLRSSHVRAVVKLSNIWGCVHTARATRALIIVTINALSAT